MFKFNRRHVEICSSVDAVLTCWQYNRCARIVRQWHAIDRTKVFGWPFFTTRLGTENLYFYTRRSKLTTVIGIRTSKTSILSLALKTYQTTLFTNVLCTFKYSNCLNNKTKLILALVLLKLFLFNIEFFTFWLIKFFISFMFSITFPHYVSQLQFLHLNSVLFLQILTSI